MFRFNPSSLLALLFIFLIPNDNIFAETGVPKDDEIIIEHNIQKLTFFINKQKELRAKLNVTQRITSKTALDYKFQKSIFFDNNSEVTKIEHTINRKKRKVTPIISDYELDGIFHSDLKMCYFEKHFTGSDQTYSFEYEKEFKDLKFLESLYFNDSHFIKKSTIIIEIPIGVEVDIREINFDKEQPTYSEKKEKKKTTHTFELENLPAAFKFKGTPRRSKFNAHLITIPNAYEVGGQKKKLIRKVDDLYEWYASIVDLTDNDNEDLKKIVSDLTANKPDDLEKIKSIYYWVQDNIRYIAFEFGIMGFKPESCQTVYSNKYGDCKGMANLTKEMLTLAGFDARLTWLGTADIPYNYDIPSLVVDNHMICTVILDGKKIFLDPTEKYSDLYNYAFRIQGQEALIEDGKSFIIERIPTYKASHNREYSVANLSLDKESVKGNGKVTFQGDRKTYILNILSDLPKNKWSEILQNYIGNRDKNILISLDSEVDFGNRDEDFKIDYQVEMEHHVIDLGNELYINLEYDNHFKNFNIPTERDVPYEFSGKYFIDNTSTLTIPKNWKITYLPPTVSIDHKKYKFEIFYEQQETEVIYYKKITIKDAYLEVEEFEGWNKAIKELDNFYSDQIILSKAK